MNCCRVLVFFMAVCPVCHGQFEVLHRSRTSPDEMQGRITGIVYQDAMIYGLTEMGDTNLFSLDTNNHAFAIHRLPTEPGQHLFPIYKSGPLGFADGRVIGSFSPSPSDVFGVRPDGTGFHVIADAQDIGLVFPNPIVAEGRVFGSSERGVFSVTPEGDDLRIAQGPIQSPTFAPLAFDGNRIFGVTWDRFASSPTDPPLEDVGIIYSMSLDGSDFRTIREINQVQISSLAVRDGKIYGLQDTHSGTLIGEDGKSVPRLLFSMNTDGTDYRVLHEFKGGPQDGANASRVVTSESKLFGVTGTGGREDQGTLFRSNLDGTDFEIIHNFGPGPLNGVAPNSDLLIIGSRLYGSTLEGGALDPSEPLGGGGIVYTLPVDSSAVPEPSSILVWLGLFGVIGIASRRPQRGSGVFS